MEFGIGKNEDLWKIIELYYQFNNKMEYSDEYIMHVGEIWENIEKNNIKYFVAKDNDKIIGSNYICIIPNLTHGGRSIGYIENVIVDKNCRRKGIGKKLMEMAIEYAKENNCYKIVLQSGMENKDAHEFYKNIGFNETTKKAFELRFEYKKNKPILD